PKSRSPTQSVEASARAERRLRPPRCHRRLRPPRRSSELPPLQQGDVAQRAEECRRLAFHASTALSRLRPDGAPWPTVANGARYTRPSQRGHHRDRTALRRTSTPSWSSTEAYCCRTRRITCGAKRPQVHAEVKRPSV